MKNPDTGLLIAAAKMQLLNCGIQLIQLAQLSHVLRIGVINRLDDFWHEIIIPYDWMLSREDKSRLEEIFNRKIDDEEIDEFADIMSGLFQAEKKELLEIFPFTIWSSLFASAYYLVEHELSEVCKLLHEAWSLDRAPHKLHHSGITRSQRYIKDVADRDFPDQTSEWNDVCCFNKVRNLIAHNGGIVDDSSLAKQVARFVEGHDELGIDSIGRIQFSHPFVVESIETLQRFSEDVQLSLFPDDELR